LRRLAEIATANHAKVAKWLSENETLHTYSETPGEYFMNLIRDLVDDSEDGATTEQLRAKYFDRAVAKGSVYTDILCNPIMIDMYIRTAHLHDFYHHTNLFQPHWIAKHFVGHHGGVSIFLFKI
jgi:hypothetical protein